MELQGDVHGVLVSQAPRADLIDSNDCLVADQAYKAHAQLMRSAC